MRLVVYPFRYKDAGTGKWVRARYMAERDEIAARYAEWEITGPRRGTAANRWVLQSGAGEGRVLVRQVVPQVPEPLG